MSIEPGIWVAQRGRCRLALFQAGWSTRGCPCLTGGFSRCRSRPWAAACHTMCLAEPRHPVTPLTCPFASQRCGNHSFSLWERGSGAETRRLVTSVASAWVPSQPWELLFSAFPPICSHAAPGTQGPLLPHTLLPVRVASSQGALPRCPAWVSPCSARPSACRHRRAEPAAGLSAGRCLVPQQVLGLVTHGHALRSGIASPLRERAVGPVWVCLMPVGLGGCRCSEPGGRRAGPSPQLHSWP